MIERTSKMLTRTRELAAKAREAAAAETLIWAKVEVAIRDAARAGALRVVVSPTKPVEIKQTDAAASLIERLNQLGFKTDWLSRREKPSEPEIHDLEITW